MERTKHTLIYFSEVWRESMDDADGISFCFNREKTRNNSQEKKTTWISSASRGRKSRSSSGSTLTSCGEK